jgi:hypothetical protein
MNIFLIVLSLCAFEFKIFFGFRYSNFGFNPFNSKISPSRGKPKPGPLGPDSLHIFYEHRRSKVFYRKYLG